MADSVLRDKAKQFAKDIVFLCREIKSSHKEAVLVNQLLLLPPESEENFVNGWLPTILHYCLMKTMCV